MAGGQAAAFEWRSSSYCNGGACVQVAVRGGMVAVRSSAREADLTLQIAPGHWCTLVDRIKKGELDPGRLAG